MKVMFALGLIALISSPAMAQKIPEPQYFGIANNGKAVLDKPEAVKPVVASKNKKSPVAKKGNNMKNKETGA